MEKLKLRYHSIVQALNTLDEALMLFEKAKKHSDTMVSSDFDFEQVLRGLRDSCIQRFEYSTDLLWKYLKDYLEFELKIIPEVRSPKNIIRSCSKIGLFTEKEAEEAITLIDSRNMTSHIYREEIAEIIAKQVPAYYLLMWTIVQRTKPTD